MNDFDRKMIEPHLKEFVSCFNLSDEIHNKLTNGKATKKELLDFSFKFLLDREPNTSILSAFELTVISQYFPEYENAVNNW